MIQFIIIFIFYAHSQAQLSSSFTTRNHLLLRILLYLIEFPCHKQDQRSSSGSSGACDSDLLLSLRDDDDFILITPLAVCVCVNTS